MQLVETLPEAGSIDRSMCFGCGRYDACNLYECYTASMRVNCEHRVEGAIIHYPEQQDLNGGVGFLEDEEGGLVFSLAVLSCGSRWINAECKGNNGHRYYIELVCGKEYCPVCGVKGSKVHLKRVKKAMSRLNHIEKFSTLTVTVPKEFSEIFLERSKLDSFYKAGIRIAKEIGEGGFARIHFFGDKKETWLELHPHLNLLIVDGGYLEYEKLEDIKKSMGRSFRAIIGQDVLVNLHYQFYRKQGDVWLDSRGNKCKGNILRHKVKYITRATVGYERIKELEFGLRSSLLELLEGDKDSHKRILLMRWWGNMSNNKYKKTIAEKLGAGALDGEGEKMLCPCCSSEMNFKIVDSFLVPPKDQMEEISPGVYRARKDAKMIGEDFKSVIEKGVGNVGIQGNYSHGGHK